MSKPRFRLWTYRCPGEATRARHGVTVRRNTEGTHTTEERRGGTQNGARSMRLRVGVRKRQKSGFVRGGDALGSLDCRCHVARVTRPGSSPPCLRARVVDLLGHRPLGCRCASITWWEFFDKNDKKDYKGLKRLKYIDEK